MHRSMTRLSRHGRWLMLALAIAAGGCASPPIAVPAARATTPTSPEAIAVCKALDEALRAFATLPRESVDASTQAVRIYVILSKVPTPYPNKICTLSTQALQGLVQLVAENPDLQCQAACASSKSDACSASCSSTR